MREFIEDCKKKLFGYISKRVKGIVKVTYNEANDAMYVRIVQAFGFAHKIEEPGDVFQHLTVEEVGADILRRYKKFIVDQFIDYDGGEE